MTGLEFLRCRRQHDAKLPTSMGYEWTGMSYQEKKVGSEAILVFALAIILVFLVLAALANPYASQMGRAILRPSDAATLQPRAKPRSGGIRAKISDTVPMGVISCECPLWVGSRHCALVS